MENIIEIKNLIREEINFINFFLNYYNKNYYNREIFIIFSFLSQEKENYSYCSIIKKKKRLEYIKEYLENTCEHEFIEDYIDIDPELSKKIVYCHKCEYTKQSIY